MCLGYLTNQSLRVVKVSNLALTIFYVCKTLCKMKNSCGDFLWKDEVANWQLSEANSMTCEKENWRGKKSNLTAVVEKLESSVCFN